MKIVIDIDDEDYKRIQGISDVFNSLTSRAYSAIRNGAPLPDTNVGDLISRQAVRKIIHKTIYQFFDVCEDDEEVPMSDKGKLLLEVNKAICNNLKLGAVIDAVEEMPSVESEKCGDCTEHPCLGKLCIYYKHTCEDCISRQAVLREFICLSDDTFVINSTIQEIIKKLPSVEPERKTGHWIKGEAYPHRIYCSECYKTFIPNDELRAWALGDIPRKYCPECGARMEVSNDT